MFYTRTYYIFVCLFVVFLSIVTIFSIKIFDIYSFTNKTNSMSPAIDTGSIILVKKYNSYNPGDIISYYAQIDGKEQIVTHRVLRLGGNVYVTKGDANDAIDREIVVPRLVIGKVVLIIPYLGYIITFAKSQVGVIISIIIPAIIIVVIELTKIFKELK